MMLSGAEIHGPSGEEFESMLARERGGVLREAHTGLRCRSQRTPTYRELGERFPRTRQERPRIVGRWLHTLPRVVRDVEHATPVSREEQFGPIIPLIAYDNEEQAVDWANDSDYGLCSSVWTTDPERGLAVARRIEAGSTFINTHSFESLDLRTAFGGVKQSGIGREFGEYGLAEYIEEHSIRYLK